MASVIQTNTHIVIEKNLWPNGTVPYVFDSIFGNQQFKHQLNNNDVIANNC